MSRNLSDIYNESLAARKKYLNLHEANNDSKMSIMNSITWITSAAILTFEQLLDAFAIDVLKLFNGRINGTPQYYANAMLKWQYQDELQVNEEGSQFFYNSVDSSKRIITHVSYQEVFSSETHSHALILKVAKGEKKSLTKLTDDELNAANAYINKIKFAGVKCYVVSRNGDVLVPKLTVYYDGSVTKDELYSEIEDKLANLMFNLKFDSVLYESKVFDTLLSIPHVTDVVIDNQASSSQGVFLAQYDDNDKLGELKRVNRKSYTTSGYVKQSTKSGAEASLPTFRESIVLKVENHEKL